MKLSGDLPRVTRSTIPERNRIYLMPGDQFEDGQYRVIVGTNVSPEAVTELEQLMNSPIGRDLGQSLERRQQVQRAVSAINTALRRADKEGAKPDA